MTFSLVRKLLRDVRVPLLVVAILLAAFQCLWAKVTQRITGQLIPLLMGLAAAQKIAPQDVQRTLFEGPGRVLRTLLGGENVQLDRAMHFLSVGYVHPLVQTILCVWAVGRAAGAIAGEIDRGTMELLLAQPVARYRVVLAHLLVDLLTIPVLCLSLWGGTWLGVRMVGQIELSADELKAIPFRVDIDPDAMKLYPERFGPALPSVAALIFAVGGYTMWISAAGRFRWRALGVAVLVTLVQFLVNVIGQLWDAVAVLRPFTVFYYYQPQQAVLENRWQVNLADVWQSSLPPTVNGVAVLVTVGVVGYLLALWTFCRRDLPAPL